MRQSWERCTPPCPKDPGCSINMSNRNVHVTVDLPVMEYYAVQNLLSPGETWFPLYSERVSSDLAAFRYIVNKKVPLAPLTN